MHKNIWRHFSDDMGGGRHANVVVGLLLLLFSCVHGVKVVAVRL